MLAPREVAMLTRTPRILLTLMAAFSVNMAGCGKVQNAAKRHKALEDLKQLGIAYHSFNETEIRPPKSYEELNKKFPLPPGCEQATVFWGANARTQESKASEVILGYMPNPAAKGVLVLYCDASVAELTDQEFSKAKKAKLQAK
jgi:hypothetical protein